MFQSNYIFISSENDFNSVTQEAKVFAQKAARSIAEIQPTGITNILDIVALLESLGYNDKTIQQYGFSHQWDLARYIFNFIDYYYYDEAVKKEKEFLETNILPLPSKKEQFVEAIVIMFPWLALLIPLYIFGISLWMAWILPADVIIAFALGTFIGMIISEGLFQVFQGIFSFYYFQGNIYEAKRTMKRYLAFTGLITSIIILIFYSFSRVQNIPYELTTYTITGTFTICFFRIFYMTIYSLKKYRIIITSYSLSILTLLLVYFTLPDQMLPTFKYFTAFGIAFLLLFSISIYFNFTIFFKKFSFTLFINIIFKII